MTIETNFKTAPNPLGNFDELKYDVLHQDIRIFIQGAEVTNDVTGSVTVHFEKGVGSNNVHFELDNALDKYILTDTNLPKNYLLDKLRSQPSFSSAQGKYSEIPKRDIYNFKIVKQRDDNTGAATSQISDQFEAVYQNQIKYYDYKIKSGYSTPPVDFYPLPTPLSANIQSYTDTNLTFQNPLDNPTDKDVIDVAQQTTYNLDSSYFINPVDTENKNNIDESTAENNVKSKGAYHTRATLFGKLKSKFKSFSEDTLFKIANDAVVTRMRLETKNTDRVTVPITNGKSQIRDPYTGSSRWDFSPGDCILTQLDPVIVFVPNPFVSADDDKWFTVFTGFLSDVHLTKDHITGHSTISIVAQDIRYLMAKMRINSNLITAVKTPEVVYDDSAGIFKDIITGTNGRTVQFSGKKFSDAITGVLTGEETLEIALSSQNKSSDLSDPVKKGVGGLRIKNVAYYPVDGHLPSFVPEVRGQESTSSSTSLSSSIGRSPIPKDSGSDSKSVQLLESWHTFAMLGSSMSFLSYADCTRIGKRTVTGEVEYDPLNKGVNLILPNAQSEMSNIVEFGIMRGGIDTFNFKTRSEIINSMLQVTNYIMYVAPHGDIMIEFPFYDFIPEDFGSWSKIFKFEHHTIGSSTTYENPDITSGVIATGGYRAGLPTDISVPQTVQNQATVIIISPKLASRYGAKTEDRSIPFTTSLDQIASYGMFKFQESLGAANAYDMQSVYRPFILPNRPVVNIPDKKMGVTGNIDNSWTVFESCSTKFSLSYIRTNRKIAVDGALQDSWEFLTGSSIMGMSYRYGYGIPADHKDAAPNVVRKTKIPGVDISGIRIIPKEAAERIDDKGIDNYLNKSSVSDAQLNANNLSAADRAFLCDPVSGITSSDDTSKFASNTLSDIQSISKNACVKLYVSLPQAADINNPSAPQQASWSILLRDSEHTALYSKEEVDRIKSEANKLGYSSVMYTDHILFTKDKTVPNLKDMKSTGGGPVNIDSAEVSAIRAAKQRAAQNYISSVSKN